MHLYNYINVFGIIFCVLFISLIQSIYGAQFLNITCSPTLFGSAGAGTRVTVTVPLASIYASL